MMIVKYILRNIKDNKFRFFLITFSIMISCALYFASSTLSVTMGRMYMQKRRAWSGTSDLIIRANRKSPAAFFSLTGRSDLMNLYQYFIGGIITGAQYTTESDESVKMQVYGFNYDDLHMFDSLTITANTDLFPFYGNKIIISKSFAGRAHITMGDFITITLNDNVYKFKVCAIAAPTGLMEDNNETTTVIVPYDKIAQLLAKRGLVNHAYVKLKKFVHPYYAIGRFSRYYKRYSIRESMPAAQVKRYKNDVAVPFLIMTVFVLFISIFIIYSSFKVITTERLPVIGTMRSIGGTRATTNVLLLLESLIYGVIGGISGIICGIIMLYIMTTIQMQNPSSSAGQNVTIYFSFYHVVITIAVALLLSIAGAIIPIIKTSRIPIKDIILDTLSMHYSKKTRKKYYGFILIALGLSLPVFIPDFIALYVTICCAILLCIGVIHLVPFITGLFIIIFEKILTVTAGNIGALSAKNLRKNKHVLNSIALLAIAFATLLVINIISSSINKKIFNLYEHARYDLYIGLWKANRNTEKKIKTIYGVTDTYGSYTTYNIEIKEVRDKLGTVEGITKKYLSYWDFGLTEEMVARLYEGRHIIITNQVKDKFSLKKDQVITLMTKRGPRHYTIIGFFDSMIDNGDYAVVSQQYLKLDMGITYYSTIYVKTFIDPGEVARQFKKRYARLNAYLKTRMEQKMSSMHANHKFIIILKGFTFLTMIIGIFGVLNNYVISFMQRKKFFAIFRSIGMSKKQILYMIFLESLIGGLISGILGVVTGVLLLQIIPHILTAIEQSTDLYYSPARFIIYMLMGMIISLLGSLGPALKSSKLNIIEAIKYE